MACPDCLHFKFNKGWATVKKVVVGEIKGKMVRIPSTEVLFIKDEAKAGCSLGLILDAKGRDRVFKWRDTNEATLFCVQRKALKVFNQDCIYFDDMTDDNQVPKAVPEKKDGTGY